VSQWGLAHLEPTDSELRIVMLLVIEGAGLGLIFVPTTVAALQTLPSHRTAQGSVVTNLIRQLAGAMGVAVLGAVIAAELGSIAPDGMAPEVAQRGYNRIFLVSCVLSSAALTAVAFMPGRRR